MSFRNWLLGTSSTSRWAPWQLERLRIEGEALRRDYPAFRMSDTQTETPSSVRGTWSGDANRTYSLLVVVGWGFPDEPPSVYITDPYPLPDYEGKPLHHYGTSHAMHTFESDYRRATKICAVSPEAWDASWTICKVIYKAQLWLTAYEFHCETGKDIDAYLL